MPERLECQVLQKVRYINTFTYLPTYRVSLPVSLKRHSIYTVFEKKHVTTFSTISWTRTVRLQRFLAHLLLRL